MATDMQACPFCGQQITGPNERGYYVHSNEACFLGHYEIDPSAMAEWNQRASRPDAQADERGEFEAWAKERFPRKYLSSDSNINMDDYRECAREGFERGVEFARAAAPQAEAAQGVPEGYALMPIDPTIEMLMLVYDPGAEEAPSERYKKLLSLGAGAPYPDREQAPYSAPFTTDVPHCCGEPETCNDPCDASPSRECGEPPAENAGVRNKIAAALHYPDHWDTAAYPTLDDAAWEAIAAAKLTCSECGEWQGAAYRYVVIGYGESDYPQAELVATHDELLGAVMGMMYTKPSDADAEIREAYRKDLDDEDEWCGGIWSAEFEIGGITIYDLGGEIPRPIAASAPTLDEQEWPSDRDAAIQACALMILGICKTRPQEVWPKEIEGRIRYMLSKIAPVVAQPQVAEPKGLKEIAASFVDWELVERMRSAEEIDSEEAGMLGAMIDSQAREIEALRAILSKGA